MARRMKGPQKGMSVRKRSSRRETLLEGLTCHKCKRQQDDLSSPFLCDQCGGWLQGSYALDNSPSIDPDEIDSRSGGMWRWRELLPIRDPSSVVSLGEGDTPLLALHEVGPHLGFDELYILDESRNPTGSFKDRGASVTVSKCLEVGVPSVVLASAGNAAISFAAYCARAGLDYIGFIRHDSSTTHATQLLAYGGLGLVVDGDLRSGSALAEQVAKNFGALNASLPMNLYRVEGKKTAAFEIVRQLGWRAPDRVICPTAGGTMALAAYQAFCELLQLGWIEHMPRIDIVQTAGCAPIATALQRGGAVEPWGTPTTRAAGLTNPAPPTGNRVARVARSTGGSAAIVTDQQTLQATRLLASREGLYLQPASSAGLASLFPGVRANQPPREEIVVLIGTGSGKNASEVIAEEVGHPKRIPANITDFEAAMAVWRQQ